MVRVWPLGQAFLYGEIPSKSKVVDENQAKACYEKV